MLSWFAWTAGAFVLSIVSALVFLRLRYRGVGPPFGPRARPWAVVIILITALVSTGIGLALAAVSNHIEVVSLSVVMPSSLWLSMLLPQRRRAQTSRTPGTWLALPFSRLYNLIGQDLQDWCDTRFQAAREGLPWEMADAVTYYYGQVQGRLKDDRARANLDVLRESIVHKMGIVRLIWLDASPARLRAALQTHPSTQHVRKYSDDELLWLAQRLESDAMTEFFQFLARVYQLGFTRLPVYGSRRGPGMDQLDTATPRGPQRADPPG